MAWGPFTSGCVSTRASYFTPGARWALASGLPGSRRAVLWGVFIWISRAAIAGAFMLRARRVAAIVLKKTTGENTG